MHGDKWLLTCFLSAPEVGKLFALLSVPLVTLQDALPKTLCFPACILDPRHGDRPSRQDTLLMIFRSKFTFMCCI